MYSGLELCAENDIVLYRCTEKSEFIYFTSEPWKIRWRRGENEHKLGVLREDRTLFAPGYWAYSGFLRTQYAPSGTSLKLELREIVNHDANEENFTNLFPTQEAMAHTVRA